MNELPTYELTYNEEDKELGVFVISIVDAPATESNFFYFSKDNKTQYFAIDSEEKREVIGVIMLADISIYRNANSILGIPEHNVFFSKSTIEKLVLDFAKNKRNDQVDLNHSIEVDGVYLIESYLVNKELGINAPNKIVDFENINDGSWIGKFKVENDNVWEQIKSGRFKGFSIEGMFEYDLSSKEVDAVEDVVQEEMSDELADLNEIYKLLIKISKK